MITRKLVYPVLLATAAGAPYVALEGKLPSALTQQAAGWLSSEDGGDSADAAMPAADGIPGSLPSEFDFFRRLQDPQAGIEPLIAGPPVRDLGEVIRFDIPPSWVTSRWPRVTTTLAETGLQGLRVPLVTGTQLDDLAGSLTYYFDPQHRLQRLTFEGFTGNEGRLVALVTQYYGLQPEATLHAGMYVARWNGAPSSVLRIARAPVMTAASPNSQLQVLLELNRPGVTFGLSPAAQQILDYDRQSFRW